ncbi:MAG TPA: chloride channel protein [Ktedonobacterales bacterium]|nr:chloride channel protein [Ktedonobacterales bacterium]
MARARGAGDGGESNTGRQPVASGPLPGVRRLLRGIAHGLPLSAEPAPERPDQREEPPALLRAFQRYTRAYFQRWLLIGALIGVVAGLGAIAFAAAISFATNVLLGGIAGFYPPQPAGEGGTAVITDISRRWLIPVVTTLGGLLTGVIIFRLAPEAEGHGTDAAIEAFHEKGGRIRARIPLVKLVASAITIGSGGSAGREGPTAQISAGFGSWLGGLLHLDDHDRRIAVAAGIGSGIGAIFKAPFGGALLSAEILYKRDFEADALFPSFVASVIGFTIYGVWAGWTPIFGTGGHFSFEHPLSLLGYLVLGITAGLVGLLYPKTLYGLRAHFHRLRIPNMLKPALGGLLVGIIGLFIPEALGMGYGYVQFSINGDYLHLAAWLMAVLVFVKILATALTIGSGGSGGVFGPGMVIGGFLGGALWAALNALAPGLVAGTNPGAFAVVGMGAFFGGIAKAPLAVILMVVEMTGEFSLLAPAMLATMVAYLVSGETSIYENQVPTRLDSPAHKHDYALPLLQNVPVRDAMTPVTEAQGQQEGRSLLIEAAPDATVASVASELRQRRSPGALIVEGGRMLGILREREARRASAASGEQTRARQVMSRVVPRAFPDEPLYAAWMRMSRRGLRQIPVVSREDPHRLVGMLHVEAIAALLRMERRAIARDEARYAPHGTSPQPSKSRPRTGHERSSTGSDAAEGNGDPLARMRVREAMLATPRLLHDSAPLAEARRLLDERGAALLVVDDAGQLVGIVTRTDLRGRQEQEDGREVRVGDVAVRKLVVAGPEDSLAAAVRKMSRLGLRQLPVVGGPLPAAPLGLLRRSDILAAYQLDAAIEIADKHIAKPTD